MVALTDLGIKKITARSVRFEVADSVVRGLRLVVQPSGSRSWVVRYRHGGRQHKLTLGTFERLKLADARAAGRELLRAVAAGRNPAVEKVAARAQAKARETDQFETVFAEYDRRHLDKNLKLSTATEVKRVFARLILPRFKDKRLPDLTRQEIQRLLDDTVDRGAPGAANQILAFLRHFLNYSVSRGYLTTSPAQGIIRPSAEIARDRVLSDDEIRWLWRAAEVADFPFGPMVQLLLLTGTRRGEVRGMMAPEFDLEKQLWTIPGSRTKNGLAHEVHLTAPTLGILKSLPRVKNPKGYLFTTNGETVCSGFSRAKRSIDREMLKLAHGAEIPNWRFHDIRRTVATGMARIGITLPVIEKCLNHISGSFAGIVGTYQRHQYQAEKRAAFEAWAAHLQANVERKPAKVLPMRRSAK